MAPVSPKVQRAAIGGVAGAVTAKAFDQDIGKGALAGATIGALCDDLGLCQPAY
ncbi:MAG: YMGG-like glycine zipper-containing protein [Paracoccus sp. (in: a-proteobacteria)]|nr:YMGG-like glycine zipper-containing protein [Paracoccus sp. (in: a-proteobacteria)]